MQKYLTKNLIKKWPHDLCDTFPSTVKSRIYTHINGTTEELEELNEFESLTVLSLFSFLF